MGHRMRGTVAALLFAALVTPVFAAPPARPAVSVTAGLKQLHFFWNRVAGATRYELWFLPTTGADWVKYAQLPPSRTRVSVNISAHLLHWANARYVLKACNAQGCGRSPHLGVSHLMLQSVGFLKPPAQIARQQMGWTTDISEDGTTLAAAIDTDESGGVEVFRKSASGWTYETRLMADPKDQDLIYPVDPATAVSGDGNVIALGVDVEIRPGAEVESQLETGAVYVFRRLATGWIREQKLTFESSLPEDKFGRRVGLDESGTLLAAWRRFGDPPFQPPGQWAHQGVVELFKHSSAGWVRHATIPVDNTRCHAMGLSGDGRTLVRSCDYTVEVFTAPAWQRVATLANEVSSTEFSIDSRAVAVSHDGHSFAVRSITVEGGFEGRAWLNVYRLGTGGWAREASLSPGVEPGAPEDPQGGYGLGVSMSRDGRFIAVGAKELGANGEGAIYPPVATGFGRGAVFVYERKPSGWRLRQLVVPIGNADPQPLFGWSVSFGRNGKDLAVGAPRDASNAAGVGGDPLDASAPWRGAVWLY